MRKKVTFCGASAKCGALVVAFSLLVLKFSLDPRMTGSMEFPGSLNGWDRWYIITQLAVYTTYIPLIVLANWVIMKTPPGCRLPPIRMTWLGMFWGNTKNPLAIPPRCRWVTGGWIQATLFDGNQKSGDPLTSWGCRLVVYPMIYRVLAPSPGGAEFLKHQPYDYVPTWCLKPIVVSWLVEHF